MNKLGLFTMSLRQHWLYVRAAICRYYYALKYRETNSILAKWLYNGPYHKMCKREVTDCEMAAKALYRFFIIVIVQTKPQEEGFEDNGRLSKGYLEVVEIIEARVLTSAVKYRKLMDHITQPVEKIFDDDYLDVYIEIAQIFSSVPPDRIRELWNRFQRKPDILNFRTGGILWELPISV